jgi:hypothetical protein
LVEASRLCRSKDQLFYETDQEGVEDIAPPQPIFDFNGVNAVKRQSAGRLSWSMFLVPEKSPSLTTSTINRFRSHAIVYRDRFIDPTTPENRVINRNLIPNPPELVESTYDYFLTDMEGGGFIPTVNQITFDGAITPDLTQTIFRDDWVMLINEEDPATSPGSAAARTNLAFARVTNITGLNLIPDRDNAADHTRLTLDGPDFQFSRQTRLVHLQNVLSVYARTINLETPSSWNISF